MEITHGFGVADTASVFIVLVNPHNDIGGFPQPFYFNANITMLHTPHVELLVRQQTLMTILGKACALSGFSRVVLLAFVFVVKDL